MKTNRNKVSIYRFTLIRLEKSRVLADKIECRRPERHVRFSVNLILNNNIHDKNRNMYSFFSFPFIII